MSKRIVTDTKCEACDGKLYIWHEPINTYHPYLVACSKCGKVHYRGKSATAAKQHVKKHKAEDMTMSQAYIENKTRDSCICCGVATVEKPVFLSIIKYCPCVETLSS